MGAKRVLVFVALSLVSSLLVTTSEVLAQSPIRDQPNGSRSLMTRASVSDLPATMPSHEFDAESIPEFDSRTVCFMPAAQPPPGLRLEMSFAPPLTNLPTDPYQMGKYGRLSIDYTRATHFEGAPIGVMIQALHVAHHLLFYSGGFTSDINNDGRFLLTAGLAHYQTGNSRAEPFVDAPFVRFRMQSMSEDQSNSQQAETTLFVYSEIETTMHFREYISGTAGLGVRLSAVLRMIGGLQHTEFVMPTERVTRIVNGLQGILQWGM